MEVLASMSLEERGCAVRVLTYFPGLYGEGNHRLREWYCQHEASGVRVRVRGLTMKQNVNHSLQVIFVSFSRSVAFQLLRDLPTAVHMSADISAVLALYCHIFVALQWRLEDWRRSADVGGER